MQITCPKCHHLLAGTDLNVAAHTAVCRACGEFFSLPTVALDKPTVTSLQRYRPADLAVTETNEGETTVLTLRASRQGVVFRGFFALVWFGFLGIWYSSAMRNIGHWAGWIQMVLPLLHVGAGVKMVYDVFGQLLNVTRASLGRDGLVVVTRPLPWGRGLQAPLPEVDGFGVFDATVRGGSGTPTPDWQVQLLRANGTSQALKLGLRDPAHAQYLADVLNARLTALREIHPRYHH